MEKTCRGTVTGSSCHYFLEILLLLEGVDPKSVRLRNLLPEAMAAALKKGEVDAIAVWEPFPFKALNSVPGAKLLPNSTVYRLSFNLVVNKKLLDPRGDELIGILRAIIR